MDKGYCQICQKDYGLGMCCMKCWKESIKQAKKEVFDDVEKEIKLSRQCIEFTSKSKCKNRECKNWLCSIHKFSPEKNLFFDELKKKHKVV